MENEKLSEIQIINNKVNNILHKVKEDDEKKKKVLAHLTKNRDSFFHWQALEKGLLSYINTDEAALKYIQDTLGQGMLMAVLKKVIPDLKESLNKIIDEQISILNPITKDNEK